MTQDWEIKFNLQAENRSEEFKFIVNSLEGIEPGVEIPSFPKDKFIRALRTHQENNHYQLYKGKITDLQFKKTNEYRPDQEIHILMIVLEKLGPISLIFTNKFEYLVLEGIDSNYNYIGTEALINILVQIIKPESPAVKGVGKIKTIYHASNFEIIERSRISQSLIETTEGQILFFGLSIILPTLFTIILPSWVLESTFSYLFALSTFLILACIYPIVKRSTRYAPLSFISILTSYLIIESLIHIGMLYVRNPWGIFNNISRQNLIGILKNQTVLQAAGNPPLFLGIDILALIIPFIDVIILCLIPFTVAVALSGILEIFDWSLKRRIVIKSFFVTLFLVSILIIPLTYHVLGKGSEGTLHASIGLTETLEMFDPQFLENLDQNYEKLLELIQSAQWHLAKSGNSFKQFSENPLIAFILPFFIPEVSGIPLQDLQDILTLTSVLADSIPYVPNILWTINNFQDGFALSFEILLNSLQTIDLINIGASTSQEIYNSTMRDALAIIQQGINNLTIAQSPLLSLISLIQQRLDYSVFGEISGLLEEVEMDVPILMTIITSIIPWINSTYKLTLALTELYEESNFSSNLLNNARNEFELADEILSIDLTSLPNNSENVFIPIHDLVDFSLNLYTVSKLYLYSVDNASLLFQELNSTMSLFQEINLANSSNVYDPVWLFIQQGLASTQFYLNQTKNSLLEMQNIINSQQSTNIDFEQLDQLNDFFNSLGDFVESSQERFGVIDDYYSALNSTYQAIFSFSLGSNSLNETIVSIINSLPYDFSHATENFTISQIAANSAYNVLENITIHLLNETSIGIWQAIVRGNITSSETNSIYTNAELCLDLIDDMSVGVTPIEAQTIYLPTLVIILQRIEQIEWELFSF